MNLNDWFEQGLSLQCYVHEMDEHQGDLLTIYNHFQLKDSDLEFLHSLQTQRIRSLVLTADWCGDAMVNLPIFMRMANEALIESSYLIRDDNPELMKQYLTNGTARSIPIIVFIDEEGKELGKWGPRAPSVQKYVDEAKQNLPPKGDPHFKEAFLSFIKDSTERFTTDRDMWEHIKDDMILALKNAVSVPK